MKKIWLVRHGEHDGRSLDGPLTEQGRRQATALRALLAAEKYDRIIVSPLTRAWQTFELSAATAPVCQYDSRLIESNWGLANFYRSLLPATPPPLAEPDPHDAWLVDVEVRAEGLISSILDSSAEAVLLFGHWGIFSRLFAYFTGVDTGTGGQSVAALTENTGVSLLQLDDGGCRNIVFWNRVSHLEAVAE